MLLIVLHFMETVANYTDIVPSLYLYDGEMLSINVSTCFFYNTNSSIGFTKSMDCVLHVQLLMINNSISVEDSSLTVAGKCYAYGTYVSMRVPN